MPLPIRHLPVLQNYDCHACANCCTDYWVPVSDEERRRIEAQGWSELPEFKGKKLFLKYGPWWRRKYRLNQGEGDRCIFLDEKGLCRIHAKFGLEAKPFACRLYPYIFIPVGDHYRLSLRFACPSAAANKGRPLTAQVGDLKKLAQEMEAWDRPAGTAVELSPPPLQGRQRVGWGDLELFVSALLGILHDQDEPIARRMLKCLALVRLCRQAKFDKVTGSRLKEFLALVIPALDAEVPRDLARVRAPGWMGRILFRSSLALFLRKDQGVRRGISQRGRLALMAAMGRIVWGRGKLPRLQAGLPDKTFEEFEVPAGPLPPEAERALERYYLIKVESLQFCGRGYYGVPVWEGFESLALTLPMICWAARGYRELGQPAAVCKAITLIDENYGYSPHLGKFRQRLAVRILAFRGELDRLIAWYSR